MWHVSAQNPLITVIKLDVILSQNAMFEHD